MCELMTAMAVAGVVTSAAGTAMQASAASTQGRLERQQAMANRQLSLRAAGDATRRGAVEAGGLRQRGARTVSLQRAAAGASGVDASSGTAVDVMSDTAAMAELDALTAANNAAREAWGYQVQGYQYLQQAKYSQARTSEALGAHLLTGTLHTATGLAGLGK